MQKHKRRYNNIEFCVLCFVTEGLHSAISTKGTAHQSHKDKRLFRNSPHIFFCKKFIRTVHQKCGNIYSNIIKRKKFRLKTPLSKRVIFYFTI